MSLQPTTGREAVEDVAAAVNRQLARRATEARRAGARPSPAERAALTEQLLADHLLNLRHQAATTGRAPLSAAAEEAVRRRVREANSTLGPLSPYLVPRLFTDVEVNGAVNMVCTERTTGRRVEAASPFGSDSETSEWVAEHAAAAGRRFDESNPSVRFRLPNGVRVHAIGRVTAVTHVDCRLFLPGLDTLAGLHAAGMFGDDLHALLTATARVVDPFGLVVSGGTGAGKTTLLKALVNAHPSDPVLDRVVTVEDEQELFLDTARFRNLVQFEAREANVDGRGEYPMERYLSENLRRQTPSRVLLGELKPDGGVMPLLLALGQGIAQGVATTIHAPTAGDVVGRLRTYAAFGSRTVSEATVMETVAATVDLVVHVARVGQRRVVTGVREYGEYRDGTVTSAQLWDWDPRAGRALRTDTEPTDRLRAKLSAAGLDPAVLARGRPPW